MARQSSVFHGDPIHWDDYTDFYEGVIEAWGKEIGEKTWFFTMGHQLGPKDHSPFLKGWWQLQELGER